MLLRAFLLLTCAMLALAVKPGSEPPGFRALDAKGGEFLLEEYRGKAIVLEWTNLQCPFVMKHYLGNNMQLLQAKATRKGMVWFTISSAAPGSAAYREGAQIEKLMERYGSRATGHLLDPEGKVASLYGVAKTPHLVVIDTHFRVIYDGAIDDKNTLDRADLKDANNYVVKALIEVLTQKNPKPLPATQDYGCTIDR